MKKQSKNRLLKLLGVGACSFVLGLSACSSNYYYGDPGEKTKQYEYVEKHTRKNITSDESTYTLSYDSTDLLDSAYWLNVIDVFIENGYIQSNPLSVSGSFTGSTTGYTSGTLVSIYAKTGTSGGQYGSYHYWSLAFTCESNIYIEFVKREFETNPEQNIEGWYTTGSYQPITLTSLAITSETYYDLLYVAPSDNMPQVLTDFMSLLVGGIQSLAVGIAQGVASMASALFLNVDDGVVTGLSTFGCIIAIFAGIALAVGITTRVYLWITRLGKD